MLTQFLLSVIMSHRNRGDREMESFKLKIEYDSGVNAPIQTLTSMHVISSTDDLDVVCGFLDTFSELHWTLPRLLDAIANGESSGDYETITFSRLG